MRAGSVAPPIAAIMLGLSLCTTGLQPVRAQATAQPAAPAAVSAEDEQKARGHFRLGRAHYDNGDFAEAAVEFEAAYRISQRSALLYNIYLAYRDASDTRHAADALRKYLKLEQTVENRGQLESRLAALDRSLAESPAAGPTPVAPIAPIAPVQAPAAQPAAAQPTAAQPAVAEAATVQPTAATPSELSAPEPSASNDEHPAAAGPNQLVPMVLMGTGGALILGSVVTGVMTLSKHNTLSNASNACQRAGDCQSLPPERVAELESVRSSGKTLAVVTDVLLFGGLAVAGTGAVLFLLNRGGSEHATPSATTAALACAPGACVGTLRTRF
jgi:tetratricopeptide (TPR) repeat protein